MTDSRRIEAEAIVAAQLEHPEGQYAPELDARTLTHVADAQLVEALLRHHHASASERAAHQVRLARVLASLEAEPIPEVAHVAHGVLHPAHDRRDARHLRGVMARGARWAAVLAVALAASVWWIATPSPSIAASALDLAIEAASRNADRTYRVTIASQADAPIRFEQEARLDTRGGERFVMRRSTALGRDIVFGSNGEETWVISPLGTVTTHPGPELLDRWRTRREAVLPFHNVREALTFLDSKYDLRLVAPGGRDASGREVVRLRGERLADAGLGPTEAEIWCDGVTGEVQRLMLVLPEAWSPSGHAARVTFELQSTAPLPEDWFDPEVQVEFGRID